MSKKKRGGGIPDNDLLETVKKGTGRAEPSLVAAVKVHPFNLSTTEVEAGGVQ